MAEGTIGDFRFGLESEELFARFTESLNRDLDGLRALGAVDASLTYADIADALLDTIAGYAGEGPIPATELATLLNDAFEQLAGEDDFESSDS